MARIIYKEGFEGINKLESIEGIEIELLNGYKALVFPRYKELPLLDEDKIESWKASELTEIQALKVIDGKALTDELLELGSPAAEFVRQFKSDRHGELDLPTLLTVGEIAAQKKDIDALAETIKGTDLLRNCGSKVWSCCRNSFYNGWSVSGDYEFILYYYLCEGFLAVPVSIYR